MHLAFFFINNYWIVSLTQKMKNKNSEEHICKFLELENKYKVLKGMDSNCKNEVQSVDLRKSDVLVFF